MQNVNKAAPEQTPSVRGLKGIKKEIHEEKYICDFYEVLYKLDIKNADQPIALYSTLTQLKKKLIKKVQRQMDIFEDYDENGKKKEVIMDSAVVIHGGILMKHVRVFLNRQRAKKGLPPLIRGSSQSVVADVIVEPNIIVKEI